MTEPNENKEPRISNNQIEILDDYIRLTLKEPLTEEQKEEIQNNINRQSKFIAYTGGEDDPSFKLCIFSSRKHSDFWEIQKEEFPNATILDAGFYTVINIGNENHIISGESGTLRTEITKKQTEETRAWLRENSGIEIKDPWF